MARELLRPEDASSLEEFEARCAVDQSRNRRINSSWRAIGQSLLISVLAIIDIISWVATATAHGGQRWVWLVFALVFTGLTLWLAGKVLGRGARGSKRYIELSRMRKEWQEKAARGEIPETSPGGVRVWRDELETEHRN
jgi:hypothetical protein